MVVHKWRHIVLHCLTHGLRSVTKLFKPFYLKAWRHLRMSTYLFDDVVNGECIEVDGDEVEDQPVPKLLESIQRIWLHDGFNLTSLCRMAALKNHFKQFKLGVNIFNRSAISIVNVKWITPKSKLGFNWKWNSTETETICDNICDNGW